MSGVLGTPDLLVVLTLFLATIAASAFGFGEALIALPLLAFLMPVEVAAPLTLVASIVLGIIVVLQDGRQIHVRSVGRLLLYSLFGVPLGLLLLLTVSDRWVKALLGIIIILFALYSLLPRGRRRTIGERWEWVFGLIAGILGGAYGMNGPPLVMYGVLRNWPPQEFRASLQGYFLPASIITAVGFWIAGLWSAPVWHYALLSLPAVLLGTVLGRAINRRLRGTAFHNYLYVGLIVVGSLLLVV